MSGYFVRELRREHPTAVYLPDRRIVVDGHVATTTGITDAMPMSLTLIEAIAGRRRAEAIAHDIGLARWDARHDSHAFLLTRPFAPSKSERLRFRRRLSAATKRNEVTVNR